MKKYVIKVNGVSYEVEVEETGSAGAPTLSYAPVQAVAPVAPVPVAAASAAAQTSVAAPAAQAAPAMQAAPAAPAAQAAPASPPAVIAGSELIKAPMPGTILSVQATAGKAVKKGEVLCILEAMKMENEIVSPRDGVVAGVSTSKGASVNAGDPLVSLQ